jgi:sec-independent protein translocase protein TatA
MSVGRGLAGTGPPPALALVFGLGVGELLLIVGVLLLLFGARKIPLLARGLGEGIRNFKGSLKGGDDDPDDGDDRLT